MPLAICSSEVYSLSAADNAVSASAGLEAPLVAQASSLTGNLLRRATATEPGPERSSRPRSASWIQLRLDVVSAWAFRR